MIRVLILFLFALSVAANAECLNSANLANIISPKIPQGTFKKMVIAAFGNKIVDLGFYNDLIDESGQETIFDHQIAKFYAGKLNNTFSCDDIDKIDRFANTKVGGKLFKLYVSMVEHERNATDKNDAFSVEEFKKKVRARNEIISGFLNNNIDKYNMSAIPVIVASKDLKAGTILNKTNVSIRQFPKSYSTSYNLSPGQAGELLGKRLTTDVNSGEPVLKSFVQ